MVTAPILTDSPSDITRAQSRSGEWNASFDFDVEDITTATLPNIASTNESLAESSLSLCNSTGAFCCNQQYSVAAITTSAGAISERYAYTAYGLPTILNASGVTLQTSNFSIRTSYTGREWDATLGLHHFRARWMSPSAGRFLGRDPIGYEGSEWGLYEFLNSFGTRFLDPDGEKTTNNPRFVHTHGIQNEISGYYRRRGMGASWCDLDKPIDDPYQILITNPTCTSVCTQQHEEQHAEDYLPCCKSARAAYQQPGADKNAVQRKWNDYLTGSRGWSECRAYKVSVKCGNDLLSTSNCACEDSTCCDDIRKYIKASENQEKKFCDEDKGAPTCPF